MPVYTIEGQDVPQHSSGKPFRFLTEEQATKVAPSGSTVRKVPNTPRLREATVRHPDEAAAWKADSERIAALEAKRAERAAASSGQSEAVTA